MKYSKAGIIKKKIGPTSDLLSEEAKRMEEKLSELKEFMMKEKEKREAVPKMKDGGKWRSAAANKPISGYADLVLTQKGKIAAKPRPAKKTDFLPTSEILGQVEEVKKDSRSLAGSNFSAGFGTVGNSAQGNADEVLEFLSACGMEKYYEKFVENGIEELEILVEVTESHLANMAIPLGHRLKIMKKIKECRESSGNKEEIKSMNRENSGLGKENVPSKVQSENVVVRVKEKVQESRTHEMCVGGDDELVNGEFDEIQSYNMFQEAIQNYRKAGSPTKHKAKAKNPEEAFKKVRFEEPVTLDMMPKDVKGLLYEGSWEPPQPAVVETFEESSGTQAAIIIKERKSCWNCYKIFEANDVYKAFDKEFCGKACSMVFFEDRCSVCVCGEKFMKVLGNRILNVCSEECKSLGIEKDKRGSGIERIEGNEDVKGEGESSGGNAGGDKIEEGKEDSSDDEGSYPDFCIDPSTGDLVVRGNINQ